MTGQTTFSPSPGLETKASSKPSAPAADPPALSLTTQLTTLDPQLLGRCGRTASCNAEVAAEGRPRRLMFISSLESLTG